jgi:hypothetical protein
VEIEIHPSQETAMWVRSEESLKLPTPTDPDEHGPDSG